MAKFKIYDINSKELIAVYDKCYDNQRVKGLDTLFINGEFYKPVDIGYNFENADFILIVQKKSAKFKFAYETIQPKEDVKTLTTVGALFKHFTNTLPYSTYGLDMSDIKTCYKLVVEDKCSLQAVKYIKENCGISLTEAKEFIEAFIDEL